jgi:hypothetical protein
MGEQTKSNPKNLTEGAIMAIVALLVLSDCQKGGPGWIMGA